MVVFGQRLLYLSKSCYIREKVVVKKSGWEKVVVFGQKGCIRERCCIRPKWLYSGKVVVFVKKWLCSGKSGCFRTKGLYSVISGCIRKKVVVFRQSRCIWTKVVVFRQTWLYSGRVVELEERGCVRKRVVVFSGKSGRIR